MRFIETFNLFYNCFYFFTRGEITSESDSALFYNEFNGPIICRNLFFLLIGECFSVVGACSLLIFLDTYFSSEPPISILTVDVNTESFRSTLM